MYERVEVGLPGIIRGRESSKYEGKGKGEDVNVNVLVKDGEEGV
jgi:hypothetical protein